MSDRSGAPAHPGAIDWERAGDIERREWLDHVADCAECRDPWLAADPTRAFALLSRNPVAPDILDKVSADVFGALEQETGYRPGNRRLRGLAALAAGVVLAVILTPWTARDVNRVDDVADGGAPAADVRILAETPPRAGVEVRSSPGTAQVIDLTVGDTQVVMIFDDRIKL